MSDRTFQPGDQHPEEWREDLNPNAGAGQNNEYSDDEAVKEAPTAYEMKDIHSQFSGFGDDELKRIPILPEGTRLKQGAVYVDLMDPQLQEFKARGDQEAGAGNRYVPKTEVDYQLWNRITGIDNAERVGDADDGASTEE